MLADGAKMKKIEKDKDGKPKEEPHRMNNDEMRAFFNRRNAALKNS